MNCCSKKCINLLTFIFAVVIFIQINILTIIVFNLKSNNIETILTKEIAVEEQEKKAYKEIDEWRLIIPKINVSAKIREGTGGEIINNYIGHFTETSTINGNIGLIAASSGYKENYFSQLKDLVEGDVIIYIIGEDKKEYKVTKNIEIEETDWSYLSNREENMITLITGILEKPENRRCVQAIEIK